MTSRLAKARLFDLRLSEEARPFDYFRVDFRQDDRTGELFLLEFNVACVLDREREFGTVARHREIAFSDLLSHIIAYSLARQESPTHGFKNRDRER